MTASPDKYPQGYFKEKPCRWCNKEFKPRAPSHLFCSEECAGWAKTANYLKATYGLSIKEYEELLSKQDGKCAICKDDGFRMKNQHRFGIVVDHSHDTGRVRGLLCHNCNRALGLFKDDVERLQSAIDYLKENS